MKITVMKNRNEQVVAPVHMFDELDGTKAYRVLETQEHKSVAIAKEHGCSFVTIDLDRITALENEKIFADASAEALKEVLKEMSGQVRSLEKERDELQARITVLKEYQNWEEAPCACCDSTAIRKCPNCHTVFCADHSKFCRACGFDGSMYKAGKEATDA